MPIRPELRKFYRGEWIRETRPRILARAGNACERCKKPNGAIIETVTGVEFVDGERRPVMFWRLAPGIRQAARGAAWHNERGEIVAADRVFIGKRRKVVVMLHVAHLNHTSGDDRDDNLQALCQWHHFVIDRDQHKETRATRKDMLRPLLSFGLAMLDAYVPRSA